MRNGKRYKKYKPMELVVELVVELVLELVLELVEELELE